MKIGIIAPTSFESLEEINKDAKKIVSEVVKEVLDKEIVGVFDKCSVAEFFAKEYLKNKGKKIYSIIPLDDKEFGFAWLNQEIESPKGRKINCGTWRNQPEKLNEETDALLCLGYSSGVLIEIAYSKWFGKKPIYIIKELISGELPKDAVRKLDIKYISYKEVGEWL